MITNLQEKLKLNMLQNKNQNIQHFRTNFRNLKGNLIIQSIIKKISIYLKNIKN